MTSANCPKCQTVVQTTREDIDVALAIFLFCCTGGIGLVIYLIVYFIQPEDRCVFCGTKTQAYTNQQTSSVPQSVKIAPNPQIQQKQEQSMSFQQTKKVFESPLIESQPISGKVDEYTGEIKADGKMKFCAMCGSTFFIGQKFCKSCGADLSNYNQ
jgi:hypothetical protein